MFFTKESDAKEGYDKSVETQKSTIKSLTEIMKEPEQFPEEKDKQKRLARARTLYEKAEAKLQSLDKRYEELRAKHESTENEYARAEETYTKAQTAYQGATEQLENFERDILGKATEVSPKKEGGVW